MLSNKVKMQLTLKILDAKKKFADRDGRVTGL